MAIYLTRKGLSNRVMSFAYALFETSDFQAIGEFLIQVIHVMHFRREFE
jgi:hypothetical protein